MFFALLLEQPDQGLSSMISRAGSHFSYALVLNLNLARQCSIFQPKLHG